MDQFQLSLNQVNFDEGAFGESDELHSFSNLVSYDSDFHEDHSGGLPIRSRRIEQYEVADSFHCNQVNHFTKMMDDARIGLGPVHYVPVSRENRQEEFHHESSSNSEATSGDISDSFKAFTETVEALALQKSVIGKKRVTPASPDEVAQIVAATKARLDLAHRQKSSDSIATDGGIRTTKGFEDNSSLSDVPLPDSMRLEPAPTHMEPGITTTDSTELAFRADSFERNDELDHDRESLNKSKESLNKSNSNAKEIAHSAQGHVKTIAGKEGTNSGGKTVEPGNPLINSHTVHGNTQMPGSSAISDSSPGIHEGKELIRISPKEISTATKKPQSSWFWSKSSSDSKHDSPQRKTPAAKTQVLPESLEEKRSKKQGAVDETARNDRKNEGDPNVTRKPSSQKASESDNQLHIENRRKNEEQTLESGQILPTKSSGVQPSSVASEFHEQTTSKKSFETFSQTTGVAKVVLKNSEFSHEIATAESFGSNRYNTPSQDPSIASLSSEQNENNSGKIDSVSSLSPSVSSVNQRNLTRDVDQKNSYSKTIQSVNQTSTTVIRKSHVNHLQHVLLSVADNRMEQSPLRQDSVDSTSPESKDLQSCLDQILKEKVKLEGQVEVLEAESSILLRERAELQSRVASLMQELQSREKSRVGLSGDRDALSADLETLRQNRGRLEAVIIDAHKLLEDKDQELRILENDLEEARNVNEKHFDQMKSFQTDVKSREVTISDLKAKITELYVDFQTTNQNRILAESEVGSLQGELKSMAAAKEWFKDQLQSSQKEKTELQAEVTRVKTEMIAQGTAIERLKAETQRTKRQLTESEQRSLNEKQVLARHLESIEADMMEQEAAFAQLQKDRQNASDSKNEDVDSEAVVALREELNKAVNDLKRSGGQVTTLHQEQTELMKRLTLSQESILERDKMIESLEKDAVDADSQTKQLKLDLLTHKDEIGRLEHDRTVHQMELRSAKEEKEVFDISLRSLKDDMSKVEKSFRFMKQELLTKQEELEKFQVELGKAGVAPAFGSEQGTKEMFEIQTGFDFSPVHSIVKSLTKYQNSETQTNTELDNKVTVEDIDVPDSKTEDAIIIERIEEEKRMIEKELAELRQIHTETESEKLQLSKTSISMEQELVILRERSLDLQLRLQQSYEEKDQLILQRSAESLEQLNAAERESEKQAMMDSRAKSVEESEGKLTRLIAENMDLRSKLGDLQRESHKEIAKQKTKILKLSKQLETASKDLRESSLSREQLAAELNQRLAILEGTNKRLEEDLSNAHQRASLDLDEKTSLMHQEIQRFTEEIESVRSAKHRTELELNQTIVRYQLEIEEYISRYTLIELELRSANVYMEERKAADAEATNLALELEREKGRLAGLLKSHSTLKEHVALLEAKLANRASSDVQMSSEVEEELRVRDKQILELKEQITLLEETITKEQHNSKDIRKQLLTEKGNHIKVRRELEQLSPNHNRVVEEVEMLRTELSKAVEVEEQLKAEQMTQKMKVEQLSTEMKAMKLERDRLSRELEDKTTRDGTHLEQIQSLEWKLSQRIAEMEAADEKARLIEERSQAEIFGLNQSLLASTTELYTVRDELTMIKHGKAELKAKVTQLKQVLISIVEQCTKATETGKAITIQMIMNREEIERLLEDTVAPSFESKPLSFLQTTLSGLRGEISCLQKQVNEHTSVVQNSSQAWRQLEAQVEDLRQVCKSSAAHRAASDKLLKTAEELSQLPPLTDIQLALQLPSSGPLVLPGNMVNIIKTTTSTTKRTSAISTVEIVADKRT